MANYDEDSVVEALRRMQPALDAITDALEALASRLQSLEGSGTVPVHPVRVVNQYDGLPDASWVKE